MPLALASGPSQLVLHGGTDVPWSPPFEYLARVFLPTVARMGVSSDVVLESRGCYPAGGGRLSARIQGTCGAPLRPLDLAGRGCLRRLEGMALACELPAHVAQRMADRASRTLRDAGMDPRIATRRERGPGPGAGIFLAVEYEGSLAGFSALGEKGKPAPRVADEATAKLLAHHRQGAAVDPHLADQLLLPMALARGRSRLRTSCLTSHLLTVTGLLEEYAVAKVCVTGEQGLPGEVCVDSDGTPGD
jgi:RNA 3'-terminal phosphate cyclase (ATP)